MRKRLLACCVTTSVVLTLVGCEGVQSVLSPAGKEARELAELFYILLPGAIVLWLLVNGLFLYVTRLNPRAMSRKAAEALIIGGGIIFPVVVLGALLSYSLNLMGDQREFGTADTRIRVTGEQWWWRVEYLLADGSSVQSANEIRLPVDNRTEVLLGSDKVIHSFWIPALAGKMDMFPGRETRLALQPEEIGTFRGQCAEFCGTSHALMAFQAVVMAAEDFDRWLEKESQPAGQTADERATRGQSVFLREGCGACHAIRGTVASAHVGPDLTHVGGRLTLGAGILPGDSAAMARWISHTGTIKPDVFMPSYGHISSEELDALAYYLENLL